MKNSQSIFIVLIYLLSSISVFSQLPIKSNDEYNIKKGIFKSFEEFIQNSPSVLDTKYVVQDTNTMEAKFMYYDDKTNKYYEYNTPVWGYCSDNGVFVKIKKVLYPIEIYKHYSIIYRRITHTFNSVGVLSAMFLGVGATGEDINNMSPTIDKEKKYILNMKTGEIEELSHSLMQEILKDDDELLTEYLDERKKKKVRVWYVKEYNKKNS